MALIVSSAPLQSLDQPFITSPQSVHCRHFGKRGPPLISSIKTPATYVGVRLTDVVCVCVCGCRVNEHLYDIQKDDDMFVSLSNGRKINK